MRMSRNIGPSNSTGRCQIFETEHLVNRRIVVRTSGLTLGVVLLAGLSGCGGTDELRGSASAGASPATNSEVAPNEKSRGRGRELADVGAETPPGERSRPPGSDSRGAQQIGGRWASENGPKPVSQPLLGSCDPSGSPGPEPRAQTAETLVEQIEAGEQIQLQTNEYGSARTAQEAAEGLRQHASDDCAQRSGNNPDFAGDYVETASVESAPGLRSTDYVIVRTRDYADEFAEDTGNVFVVVVRNKAVSVLNLLAHADDESVDRAIEFAGQAYGP